MEAIHDILFNAHILYSSILGIWAAITVARNEALSGGYWGAVMISAFLAGGVLLLGLLLTALGFRPRSGRLLIYFLYMAWLTIIMPGLFSLLKGRDDRSAAIAYTILAFFNTTTSISMVQRDIVTGWVAEAAL